MRGFLIIPIPLVAPLLNVSSCVFIIFPQGYSQSPIQGHGAGASRSSRDENDNHNSNEPIISAGVQIEPIQVSSNGVVNGGAAQENGEVTNGEATNGSENIVGAEMEGVGRSGEVAENGEVNHEPSEGMGLSEETEPSEASSAGFND